MLRILAVVLAVVAPAAGGRAMTIKLATLAPEGSPYHDIIRDLGTEWSAISQGRIVLRIYAGGIAGDEGDMVKKMRIGQLQAAVITGGGLADIDPQVRALQMPMMFRSYEELDYVRDRVAARLEAGLDRAGFTVLAWGEAGWLYFFTQSPVVYPDDMKPLKLFVWTGNTTLLEAWKNLGFQAVPLAVTELHLALASRLVNAMLVPPLAALSFQWFALANHVTDLKFAPLIGALVITNRAWQAIAPATRLKLRGAARRTEARLRDLRRIGAEAIAVMKEHGLIAHPTPPDAVEQWSSQARHAYPTLMATIPADLVAEVERLRDAYRAGRRR